MNINRNKGKWTDLAIKEIAPRIRRSFLAKRFKIPKAGHRLSLDCDVAKSDRLDKNMAEQVGRSGRAG